MTLQLGKSQWEMLKQVVKCTKAHDGNFGGYSGMASVLQGPGGVLGAPYLGSLRESLFDTLCIIDVK